MKLKAQRSCNIIYHGKTGYDAHIKVRKGSAWNCRSWDGLISIHRNSIGLEIDEGTLTDIFGVTAKEIEIMTEEETE